MNESIMLDSRIRQTEGNLASVVDGEKVLLHMESCSYYNLGDIGGEIWSRLEQETTARQVVDSLLSEYAVEEAECEIRVLSFLEDLRQEGLIAVCN